MGDRGQSCLARLFPTVCSAKAMSSTPTPFELGQANLGLLSGATQ